MLREKATSEQKEYEIVLLEELVPEDHLLRKINKAVDFSFIHDLCKDLYLLLFGNRAFVDGLRGWTPSFFDLLEVVLIQA